MSWVGTLMPLLEPPDPQHIGDTMTNENEKIKQLEARIKELETKCEELESELEQLDDDIAWNHLTSRAICELQEYLSDKDPSFFCINRINSPTMVGMQ